MQKNISLHLNKFRKLLCKTCKKLTDHKESKIFYQLPYELVLYFERGINNENKFENKLP